MSRAEPSAPRGESPWSCSEPRQVKARPSSIGAVSSLSRTVLPSGGGRGQMSEREIPSKVPRHVDWPRSRVTNGALRRINGIVWRPSVTWLPMSAIA